MKRLTSFLLIAATLFGQAADITLGWTASPTQDQTLSYNVYVAVGGSGSFSLLGSTTNTQFAISGLNPGAYQFYCTATNIWGESVPSNIVKTPAGKPGAVTIQILK